MTKWVVDQDAPTVRQTVRMLAAADPDRRAVVTFPITATVGARRPIRVWLDRVEASDVEVGRWEQKGLFSSEFTVRLSGRAADLASACAGLVDWMDALEATRV